MSLAELFASHVASPAVQPYFEGSLRDFATSVNPQFKWYRHVAILGEALEAVVAGQIKRLMVFEPPRHGKSLLGSRIFPAYALAKKPQSWLGVCSYEATLAQDFSRTARDNYRRVGGRLRDDSQAVNLWQTPQNGGMWAAGVGGPITGRGFNIGMIDDPLKNAEEAASQTIREKHKSWYASTFYTRQEPDSAIVITQTRWHEDDLSGWLLSLEEEEPSNWYVINLPAIKDGSRQSFPVSCNVAIDTRGEGEALCPERYSEHQLDEIRRKVGSRVWEALYQQRPAPDSGTIFKREWWQFYDPATLPAKFNRVIQSWDLSFKDEASSDFVSGQIWARDGARFYLLDRVKERMSFTGTCNAIRSMTAKWPRAHGKYIEDKANGPAVINALTREVHGIVAVQPDGGKVARAYAIQPLVEAHNCYLPKGAPWVEDFMRELATFPNGAHDDDVDACTQALNQLAWGARESTAKEAEVSAFDPSVLEHMGHQTLGQARQQMKKRQRLVLRQLDT